MNQFFQSFSYLRALTISVTLLTLVGGVAGCARTEIVESPKTAFASDAEPAKDPEVIWTSRSLTQGFDYLAEVKVRSWTYEGAIERLKDAGKELKADAIIDVHYQTVGFLTAMSAFAVKFK